MSKKKGALTSQSQGGQKTKSTKGRISNTNQCIRKIAKKVTGGGSQKQQRVALREGLDNKPGRKNTFKGGKNGDWGRKERRNELPNRENTKGTDRTKHHPKIARKYWRRNHKIIERSGGTQKPPKIILAPDV